MGGENNQKIFYGWWIVVASSIIIFFSTGIIFYSFGVFVPRLEEDLGWSSTMLGLAVSAWALLFGFSGPLVGIFFQKYGAKKVIATCAALTGVCYVLLSRMSELYYLFIAMSIIGFSSAAWAMSRSVGILALPAGSGLNLDVGLFRERGRSNHSGQGIAEFARCSRGGRPPTGAA